MSHALKRLTGARSDAAGATEKGVQKLGKGRWLLQLLPDLLLIFLLLIGFIFLFNLWWYVPVALRAQTSMFATVLNSPPTAQVTAL